MGKIKLNLESGAVVEKPLIIAFQANNFEYVILDNEMNGSMGLPIILVCKFENDKLIKIEDQNEWQIVKEYLKNIIAGSVVELVKVPNILSANDVYYTQLTLPVPSFDALKNAYTIAGSDDETGEVGIADINVDANPTNAQPTVDTPASPVSSEPVINVNSPEAPVSPMPQSNVVTSGNETPNVEATAPAIDLGMPNAPVMNNPAPAVPEANVDLNEPIPVFGDVRTNQTPVNTENTPVSETPAVENVQPNATENEPVVSIAPSTENESPFKEQKEAFMQACENMFDALVQKFEKELENRK